MPGSSCSSGVGWWPVVLLEPAACCGFAFSCAWFITVDSIIHTLWGCLLHSLRPRRRWPPPTPHGSQITAIFSIELALDDDDPSPVGLRQHNHIHKTARGEISTYSLGRRRKLRNFFLHCRLINSATQSRRNNGTQSIKRAPQRDSLSPTVGDD